MSHQLINQDSGNTEYYTDPKILEKARQVLGHIDLDPASSPIANQKVGAAHYFTEKDDGLKQVWSGNVWMNHPFSKGEKACNDKCKKKTCKERGYHIHTDLPGNKDWINKLDHEYRFGKVSQALCICFAATSEGWFQPLAKYPQCYLAPRTNYYDSDGNKVKGVTKGSVITYLGDDVDKFYEAFKDMGEVKVPWGYQNGS